MGAFCEWVGWLFFWVLLFGGCFLRVVYVGLVFDCLVLVILGFAVVGLGFILWFCGLGRFCV